ncbi:ribonuclease H-like domain-containing protein [Tanacetum coccineum]|uniref:Ribonuclease H-like domain-containing protein n=1 Tax=Tanacetum coccineum TaxID=301880 RepID=A0ABQ5DA69_9ASTR
MLVQQKTILMQGILKKEDESAQTHTLVLPIWVFLILNGHESIAKMQICPLMGRRQRNKNGIYRNLEGRERVVSEIKQDEAIRIFLAFASYMGFIVYQMDVKSAFLYGKIDEETQVDPHLTPSPRPSPTSHIRDSILESSDGNQGDQAKEIQHLKAQIKKLKKQAKPVITHHRAWMKSVSLKQRLAGKAILKENLDAKRVCIQTGEEETKRCSDMGGQEMYRMKRWRNADLNTDGSKVSTNKEKDSTDRTDEAKLKAVSRENEKGVEFKDVEETERPRPTSTRSLLTLKPLPKIDPKDKGKKKIEEEDESETESEGIPEAEKKFKQLASDEEMARKLQEDWETEEERKRLAEEEATK